MKRFLFILSFILAYLFCSSSLNPADKASQSNLLCPANTGHSSIDRTACGARNYGFNLQGILSSSASGYSEESHNFSPSVRNTGNGRRVQSSSRSTFRMVKAGKLIDTQSIYTFQSALKLFSSGIHSNARFILSICNLRI